MNRKRGWKSVKHFIRWYGTFTVSIVRSVYDLYDLWTNGGGPGQL